MVKLLKSIYQFPPGVKKRNGKQQNEKKVSRDVKKRMLDGERKGKEVDVIVLWLELKMAKGI